MIREHGCSLWDDSYDIPEYLRKTEMGFSEGRNALARFRLDGMLDY